MYDPSDTPRTRRDHPLCAAIDTCFAIVLLSPAHAQSRRAMGGDQTESLCLQAIAAFPSVVNASDGLAAKLDNWVDGVVAVPPPKTELQGWRKGVEEMLDDLTKHLSDPSAVMVEIFTASDHEQPIEPASAGSQRAADSISVAQADADAAAVRSSTPLAAQVLTALCELSAPSGASSTAEPLHFESVSQRVELAIVALAGVGRAPAHGLRQRNLGAVCRLLNAELTLAQAQRRSHRTRRLAAALSVAVTSLRRPHLGRASDAHKLLPLLLRWAALLDVAARASVLRAVRHCISELPATDVRWHGALLSYDLRKLLVFREADALCELLPALFDVWPHVTSEQAVSREEAEKMHLALVETLYNELLYIAPDRAVRRLYLSQLPAIVPQLGLLLCLRLGAVFDAIAHLVRVESDEAAHAMRMDSGSSRADAAIRSIRDALILVECILRQVWPRAHAHAAPVAKHAIAACIRVVVSVEVDGRSRAVDGGAIDFSRASPVVDAAKSVLRLLCAAGGAERCAAAIKAARVASEAAGGPVHAAALRTVDALSSALIEPPPGAA